MAVVRTERTRKLQIKVNEGTTQNPTMKTRSIGNWIFAPDAQADKLYTAASQYADLQQNTLTEVNTIERVTLETE